MWRLNNNSSVNHLAGCSKPGAYFNANQKHNYKNNTKTKIISINYIKIATYFERCGDSNYIGINNATQALWRLVEIFRKYKNLSRVPRQIYTVLVRKKLYNTIFYIKKNYYYFKFTKYATILM